VKCFDAVLGILRQKGFSASNIGGGYKTYKLFHPTPASLSSK
jgi:hypothetical protein